MRRSTNGGMRVVPRETIIAGIPADARKVGLVGAVSVARLMSGLLYGVSPADVGTFAGVTAVLVGATLAITVWAGRHTKTAADFYAGGRSFSGFQNGMAIGGDYMSAASFLGISGAIAVYGYDGFLYSIGFLVAWLVALLLVAELMRNTGKFTMADVLSFRLKQGPVRMAAAISTLAVSLFGDPTADYDAALQRHYQEGAPDQGHAAVESEEVEHGHGSLRFCGEGQS